MIHAKQKGFKNFFKQNTISIADTGSESVLYDVKITDDILKGSNGHNAVQDEPFKFYYDEHSECQDECKER